LKAEVAAGLSVPVNAQRVLENLGYSKANLKGVNYEGVRSVFSYYFFLLSLMTVLTVTDGSIGRERRGR
jgi:hypothetical protein